MKHRRILSGELCIRISVSNARRLIDASNDLPQTGICSLCPLSAARNDGDSRCPNVDGRAPRQAQQLLDYCHYDDPIYRLVWAPLHRVVAARMEHGIAIEEYDSEPPNPTKED